MQTNSDTKKKQYSIYDRADETVESAGVRIAACVETSETAHSTRVFCTFIREHYSGDPRDNLLTDY